MTQSLSSFGPDWGDVVRRARRGARRRLTAQATALLVVVAAGVASAWALGHPVIDFGSAQHAGLKQVDEFGSLEVAAPRGMAPGVLPHEARKITTVRFDGKAHTLYVAPTRSGGYCYVWSDLGGGCRARNDRIANSVYTGGMVGPNGLQVLETSFLQRAGDRLVMSFADGAMVDVPFVWVTAPIDAGFALYRVPDAHRTAAARAVSLALYDASGKLVATNPIQGGEPPTGIARVAGYPTLMVPNGAEWSLRRQLYDLRAPNGQRVGLWVMPKRGGGECFVTNTAAGCGSPAERAAQGPAVNIAFNGPRLFGTVAPSVVRVKATFQDGTSVELVPREGYVLWPVTADHYALGHRLVSLVGYDAAGEEVGRSTVPAPADQRGIYPCAKPKDLGYGVQQCP